MVTHARLQSVNTLSINLAEKVLKITYLFQEADGPFLWSSEIQGIILSCYFWGYFASQIPGKSLQSQFFIDLFRLH